MFRKIRNTAASLQLAFFPSPTTPSFFLLISVQLSRGCIPSFTKQHKQIKSQKKKRKKTPTQATWCYPARRLPWCKRELHAENASSYILLTLLTNNLFRIFLQCTFASIKKVNRGTLEKRETGPLDAGVFEYK